MLKNVGLLILSFLVANATLAQSSYVGVYTYPRHMVLEEEMLLAVAPRDALQFKVSVANEEGHEELFMEGGGLHGIDMELWKDGRKVDPSTLDFDWTTGGERYAFFGGLPPEPTAEGVLEPGVGFRSELRIRNRSGKPFSAGSYQLWARVNQGSLLRADGTAWVGRGGLAESRFVLFEPRSFDETQLARTLIGGEALQNREYGRAAEIFAEQVDADATNLGGWARLGLAYFHLGRHEEAAQCMERIMPKIVAEGSHSSLPFLLAESYVALGLPEKAAVALRSVVLEQDIDTTLERIEARVVAKRAESADR